MKLLGWMHRKTKLNTIQTFKNLTIGNSCTCFSARPFLDEQQYYPESNNILSKWTQPQRVCPNVFAEFNINNDGGPKDANTREEVIKESSNNNSELFNGFLAIGTLGSEAITTEPATPTLPTPFENVTEMETEVTENELKLINNELEKFLEAEAELKGNESSERSSHVSIITLTGKHVEGLEAEEYGNLVVCPLQEYLFGTSIELPETSVAVKKEKTSLGELFSRSCIPQEHSPGTIDGEEKGDKRTITMGFIQKMMKKIHSSPRSCKDFAIADATVSLSTKRKVPKVLRMFHRKIYPENSMDRQKSTISKKDGHTEYEDGDLNFQGKDGKRFPITDKKHGNLNLLQNKICGSGSTWNREHWIKTDADYLVLEL